VLYIQKCALHVCETKTAHFGIMEHTFCVQSPGAYTGFLEQGLHSWKRSAESETTAPLCKMRSMYYLGGLGRQEIFRIQFSLQRLNLVAILTA